MFPLIMYSSKLESQILLARQSSLPPIVYSCLVAGILPPISSQTVLYLLVHNEAFTLLLRASDG